MQGGTLTVGDARAIFGADGDEEALREDKIRRFLKYELDGYLSDRDGEVVEELPLERVENQQYIHYRKGSVAMYLLQQRMGEDAVDLALYGAWRNSGSRAHPIRARST